MQAILLAGGSGTRLWPISRAAHPKPLLSFLSPLSMLQETLDRFLARSPLDRIWVISAASCIARFSEHLADAPRIRLLSEPFPLGTTLAVGLAMMSACDLDSDEILVIAWTDGRIENESAFGEALRCAEEAALLADGALLGAKPTYPATSYGYVQAGTPLKPPSGGDAFRISRFVEKPDEASARRYLAEGGYLWNAGISVWRANRLAALFRRFQPDAYDALLRVRSFIGTSEEATAIERELGALPKTSIDRAIYEKAEDLAVVPAAMGWSDVGSWDALKAAMPADEAGNAIRGGEAIAIDTRNCLILGGERLIVTLGLRDLAIIDAGDCLLVMDQSEAQRVKEVVARLKATGREKYL